MLRLSIALRHKIRDRGGNMHNFAFDTMTKVYRDAMYTSDKRYAGNPMYPEHDKASVTGAALAGTSVLPQESLQAQPERNTATTGSNSSTSPVDGMRRAPRRSGVQLEILGLYRDLLRETRRMEDPQTRENLRRFIRAEFSANSDIPRKFVTRIEWQLHHGRNKLEELRGMRSDTKFSFMR
ncbi:hypothetical protein DQ04_00171090 [Trypanosoma grayi]|uniref:hypothetical protein n=1 Tax=Trypanosoma grayi TaxID=71804 RepID=UPI0004F42305|nr:hypothetical protein DQ04_00171090 [Trypanosoma grayi]KEG15145.1 hypothetical protein DQ04_00171090 [Trypanosoma grayi]